MHPADIAMAVYITASRSIERDAPVGFQFVFFVVTPGGVKVCLKIFGWQTFLKKNAKRHGVILNKIN